MVHAYACKGQLRDVWACAIVHAGAGQVCGASPGMVRQRHGRPLTDGVHVVLRCHHAFVSMMASTSCHNVMLTNGFQGLVTMSCLLTGFRV